MNAEVEVEFVIVIVIVVQEEPISVKPVLYWMDWSGPVSSCAVDPSLRRKNRPTRATSPWPAVNCNLRPPILVGHDLPQSPWPRDDEKRGEKKGEKRKREIEREREIERKNEIKGTKRKREID